MGEGRPLRATDKEEGKREGRPYINMCGIMYNCTAHKFTASPATTYNACNP
jgi:hypothetical protein